MKPVFINSLPPALVYNTIWGTANKIQNNIEYKDLENIFDSAPAKPVGGGNAAASAPPKEELISFISDGKRSQSINIMVKKFKRLQWEPLRNTVINLDGSNMDSDEAAILMSFAPEQGEIAAAKSYDGDLSKIDDASRYILEMQDVPRMAVRLKNFIFTKEFADQKRELDDQTKIVIDAAVGLRTNIHFQTFLKIALDVVNKMNEGTPRGNCQGFKMESLNNLMSTRGKNNTVLIQYLIGLLFDQSPDTLSFLETLIPLMAKAEKINIEGTFFN